MHKLAILNTHPIQYFAPLYRRLAKEPGIDLTVYFCSRQGVEQYFDPGFGGTVQWDTPLLEGYRYKFLNNLRRRDQVAGFWSLINPQISRELRRHRYDALWINGHNHATYVLGIFAAQFLGIPVFMRCETHLALTRSSLKRAVRKPLMSFFYQHLCDVCLPIGTLNRAFYTEHGVSENKLFTVPYAVDNDYFAKAAEQYPDRAKTKSELGLPTLKPAILFASKMSARKRPMDLLMAFQRVRDGGRDAALAFVGSGEQDDALKHYVVEHQLPDVYFFGFRNQTELPRFYSAADIFAFPSENEPWGLVLNEVMCAGLPVVASREIGAVPDLVQHGENGFVFEAGNVDQLTDYLRQLVTDPQLRARMGIESLRRIQEWDFEACVRGVKQALATLKPRPKAVTFSEAA